MFGVERDLAAAVRAGGGGGRGWRRKRRLAAQMNHLRRRRKQHMAPASADRRAEIDVLQVHEVALVEEANRVGVAPPDQQAGPADPIGEVLSSRRRLDGWRADARLRRVTAHQDLLPQLVEWAHHAAERQLGTPGGVHQARPDDGHAGASIELVNHQIEGARRNDGVAVEQQQVDAGARPDADVGSAREPQVLAGFDHADIGPSSRGVGAAVRGRVVDDDDLVAVPRRNCREAPEGTARDRRAC